MEPITFLLNGIFLLGLYIFLHKAVMAILHETKKHGGKKAGYLVLLNNTTIYHHQANEMNVLAQGDKIPIGAGLTMGRQEDNDLIIIDPYISSKHGEIFIQNGSLFLRDCGSLNKTRINGMEIAKPKRLRPGDEIGIGEVLLGYEE